MDEGWTFPQIYENSARVKTGCQAEERPVGCGKGALAVRVMGAAKRGKQKFR
jgi:hypothetical protein